MIFRWVERNRNLTPLGGDFSDPEEAIAWGKEYKGEGFLSPELLEAFLIVIDGNKTDLYKPNGSVVNLASL